MNLHLSIGPLVSLLAGILILIMPRLLNYIVALYLIIIGVIGLVGADKLRLMIKKNPSPLRREGLRLGGDADRYLDGTMTTVSPPVLPRSPFSPSAPVAPVAPVYPAG